MISLKNILIEVLLEEVYGNMAIVYHRTKAEDISNKIYTSGFKPGDGDMYGKAMYSTYELASQEKEQMLKYGNVIVKFAVPIENFIVFDYDVFVKSPMASKLGEYTKDDFIKKQLDYFGMEYNPKKIKWSADTSSEIARSCYEDISAFDFKCDGIIFTGRQDGKVLACYNTELLIPLSYRRDGDNEFTKYERNMYYIKTAWKRKSMPFKGRNIIPNDYGIKNWNKNSDGKIDVNGNVSLEDLKLKTLPFKFGKVTGWFNCASNNLQSLEGCPEEVGETFNIKWNNGKEFTEEDIRAVCDVQGNVYV